MLKRIVIACILAGFAASPAAAEPKALQVVVWNLKKAVGTVRVSICTKATFLHESCPWHGTAPATGSEVVVNVPGVPPGVYAAQVFQDEKDTQKVNRNVLGIPTEGVGFSNDAPIHLKAPSFRQAAFDYSGGDEPIRVKLRYLAEVP
jgi:uncharacterized protein (DUF2141 family)